jgi:hypothetical protein
MKSQSNYSMNFAVLFLPVLLGLVGGLDLASSLKLGLLVILCGAPGVLLLSRMCRRDEIRIDIVGLGVPLGLLLALLSQQVGIALRIGTLGWIMPVVVSIPFQFRFFRNERLDCRSFGTQQFIASAGSALFLLSDIHWAFLLAAISAVVALAARPKMANPILVGGLVGTKFLLPEYWYLISDDRWFEEAYSRSTYSFGFWDWFGSSATWVPYHWLGHTLGGLAQGFVSSQIFVAVGIVPSVITAIVFSSSVASIFSTLGGSVRWTAWCTLLCPVFGVFARGESNSADLSIAFGVWLIALVLLVIQHRKPVQSSSFIVGIASASLLLIKVSTGIVVITGILSLVMYLGLVNKIHRRLLGLGLSIAALGSVALVINFDFFGIANNDDSRSQVVITFGGFLSLDGTSIVVKLLVVGSTALSGVLLPSLIIARVRDRRSVERSGAILALVILGTGWMFRLFVVSFNNQYYLEAAVLCASPLLVGAVLREIRSEKRRGMFVLSMLFGVVVGFLQILMISKQGSTRIDAIARLLGNSLILLLPVCVLLVGTWVSRQSSKWRPRFGGKLIPLMAVCLLGAQAGPDTYRIVDQLRSGDVWAETNFGGDDSYFFGNADEQRAGSWLRINAQKSDLIGTNRICQPFTGCSAGGQTPIAAWSGLRSFVEGERFITGRQIDELLPGEQDVRGYPEWLTNRQMLLYRFGNSQSRLLSSELEQQGVDWYWLDLRIQGSRLAPNQEVAFQSGSIVIIRL